MCWPAERSPNSFARLLLSQRAWAVRPRRALHLCFCRSSAVGPSTTPATHSELHSPYPLLRSDTCLLRSPDAVCFRQVGTPDASFRLTESRRLREKPLGFGFVQARDDCSARPFRSQDRTRTAPCLPPPRSPPPWTPLFRAPPCLSNPHGRRDPSPTP
jgi:hypothetical protein